MGVVSRRSISNLVKFMEASGMVSLTSPQPGTGDMDDGLLELAGRCGRAHGPDRGLDWMIHLRDGLNGVGAYGSHPLYTASIDAAMTLVPEDWGWCVDSLGFAKISPDDVGNAKAMELGPLIDALGASPALALCNAALRAHDRIRRHGAPMEPEAD